MKKQDSKPESKKEPAKETAAKAGANHTPPVVKKHILPKDELERYKKLLIGRREALSGNVSQMEDEALHRNRQDASGDGSSMPIHIADLGTDNFEQEFTLGLIEGEEEELREIEDALTRIDQGGFGECEVCAKPIPRDRLSAIPYTRVCVECKTKQEGEEET